jgi:glycerol uptake facilitator-like aquaporin
MAETAPVARRILAEFTGTAMLVTAIVGSGIMARRLSPDNAGVQLLENSIATTLALGVLILIVGPVSGAHLNPVVSIVDWLVNRHTRPTSPHEVVGYIAAQTTGAIGGAVLANLMFGLGPIAWSRHQRAATHLWLGEVVATAGLILLIAALTRTGRTSLAAPAVAAYIGAAYWFTSSTSFANPAVSVGRAFTDTFAGIAPASLPGFVLAQLLGAGIGAVLAHLIYPVRQSATAITEPARHDQPLTVGGDR